MIKAEELANPESCINKALDNEMVFVLLERDKCAPEAIRYWAYLRAGGKPLRFFPDLPASPPEDPNVRQLTEAYATADRMDTYRNSIRKQLGKEPT